MNSKLKNLLVRTASGAIFVTLVVSSFFLPIVFQYVLFSFFAVVGTWEYLTIVAKDGSNPQKYLSMIAAFLIVSASYHLHWNISPLFFCILLSIDLILIPIFELFKKSEKPFSNLAHSFLPLVWVAFPFYLSGSLFIDQSYVLALLILIWASDTFAYCGGSLLGKHKLFERISPKKTWEGSIIGGICTLALSIAFAFIPYFGNSSILFWMGLALIAVVFGTLGDLIESMFKRSYQVKDSGKIMPGHGGILDRFDSFIFAIPVAVLYIFLIDLCIGI